MFFGRDVIVQELAATLLKSEHIALIGLGGIEKSSIAKALLHEKSLVLFYGTKRYFVTYDGIVSPMMSLDKFLVRIADAIGLSSTNVTSRSLVSYLQSTKALLVLDNAETFLETSESGLIAETIAEIGALDSIQLILTTRNQETVPYNMICQRKSVAGLSRDAAWSAFSAIFPIDGPDKIVDSILLSLGYHPLSINILANAAAANQWSVAELQEAWLRQKSRVLDSGNDKYRSLRIAIQLSIDCLAFQGSRETVLIALRTVAFLPLGVHRPSLPELFPSLSDLTSVVDSLCRCSLLIRRGQRLQMLAPVRMYVTDEYNSTLTYTDPLLLLLREPHYANLDSNPKLWIARESANMERILSFDLSSEYIKEHSGSRLTILRIAYDFLEALYNHYPRATSILPLLVAISDKVPVINLGCFKSTVGTYQNRRLTLAKAKCLVNACWVENQRLCYDDALRAIIIAEDFCRSRYSVCEEELSSCLRVKGVIYHRRGNLHLADEALSEGLAIARSFKDPEQEAVFNQVLSLTACAKGNVTEATTFLVSAEAYFRRRNQHARVIESLLNRSQIAIQERDFDSARGAIAEALELRHLHEEGLGPNRLEILAWQASAEAFAGNVSEAVRILDEIIQVDVSNAAPGILASAMAGLQGRSYYAAKEGNIELARKLLLQARRLFTKEKIRYRSMELSACYVEQFAGNASKGKVLLLAALQEIGEDYRQWGAMLYRALGEIACVESNEVEAKEMFGKAKGLCESMGMPTDFLYVNHAYWHTLSNDDYAGWSHFLTNTA